MRVVILNMPNLVGLRDLAQVVAEKLRETTWTRIDPFDHLLDTADQHAEDVSSGLTEAIITAVRAVDRGESLILDWRLTKEMLPRFVSEVCRADLSVDVVTISPTTIALQNRAGVELQAKDRSALRRFFQAKRDRTPSTAMIDSFQKEPQMIADEIIRMLRLAR
jgi:hypothetical protein